MYVDENVFKPIIKELIQYYYNNLQNPTGGNLHIAIDDGNLEDNFIYACQLRCKEENDNMGYLIGTILRGFTLEEREKMYNGHWE